MRLRFALPLAYFSLGILAATLHVSNHGGLAGDYVLTNDIAGTLADIGDLADAGQVFFNRWRVPDESDPLAGKAFVYLGLPAFLLALPAGSLLGLLSDEMNEAFPFGLSYLSYRYAIGTAMALIQWYWIGRLVERFRTRD